MSPASSWVFLLQPNLRFQDSILQLTPALLDQHQLQGLVLDVDDTVVSSRSADVSPELLTWLADIKAKVPIWLVSNNLKRSYIYGAGKPSRRKLRQAVTAMNLPYENVAMVGDRLFTDVLAGNRLGVFTILVEPMGHGSTLRNIELWLYHYLERILT